VPRREALRTFALERIHDARLLAGPAVEIDEPTLDAHYAGAYGISAGPAERRAVLRFNARRARWVADETWHPDQQGRHLPDAL
jgi:proteasome accessory factor C